MRIAFTLRVQKQVLEVLLVTISLLTCVVSLQSRSHAFENEFSTLPDEPAHYTTGLMIHDYLKYGLRETPLAFAHNFYRHYPEVAFGAWPPLFHIIEAIWMLLFSPSRVAILLLTGFIVTALAATLYWTVRGELGVPIAVAVAFLLTLIPAVQSAGTTIMPDGLIALLDFWAMLLLAKFLKREKDRDVILFGAVATFAALTKANGFALLIAPFIGIWLSGKRYLFFRRSVWCAILTILAFAGPWEYYSWMLVQRTTPLHAASIGPRSLFYVQNFLSILGVAITPIALVGAFVRIRWRLLSEQNSGLWPAAVALILSVFAFHALLPVQPDPRYIISAIAPALLFFAAGVLWIGETVRWPDIGAGRRSALVGLCSATVFLWLGFYIPQRSCYGLAELAKMFQTVGRERSILLVSSQSLGEGIAVSEIAMRDRRPGRIVLRASKVLSTSDWYGHNYKLMYATPETTMTYLASVPIDFVIMDMAKARLPQLHHSILLATIEKYPDRFRLLETFPREAISRGLGADVRLYRVIGQHLD